MNDMVDTRSESFDVRIARLLRTYSERAGERIASEALRLQASAMASGLEGKCSIDELYDLFEIAVQFKAVPDYRSCIRAMSTSDWDVARRERYLREKAAQYIPQSAIDWTANQLSERDRPWVDRLNGKNRNPPTIGEVRAWWDCLCSLNPDARRMIYRNGGCPYGAIEETARKLGVHCEVWTHSETQGWLCDGVVPVQ